jgi:hypothetical protein
MQCKIGNDSVQGQAKKKLGVQTGCGIILASKQSIRKSTGPTWNKRILETKKS